MTQLKAYREYPVLYVAADCRIFEYVNEGAVVGLHFNKYRPNILI